MKSFTLIGITLILLGAAALAYQGITYTTREKIVDIGPLEATAEKQKTIVFPPALGALTLAGGIGFLIAGAKRP